MMRVAVRTPMALTLPPMSTRPLGSGPAYPISLPTAAILSRSSGRTFSGRLKAFDAVPSDTPALLATSASRTRPVTVRLQPEQSVFEALHFLLDGTSQQRVIVF